MWEVLGPETARESAGWSTNPHALSRWEPAPLTPNRASSLLATTLGLWGTALFFPSAPATLYPQSPSFTSPVSLVKLLSRRLDLLLSSTAPHALALNQPLSLIPRVSELLPPHTILGSATPGAIQVGRLPFVLSPCQASSL